MDNQGPVLLRPEEVSEDLICSICMTVPVEPVMTPCDHIFCRKCIVQALRMQNLCPVDRFPCEIRELSSLQGFSYRIWSNIKVTCGKRNGGCAWKGSIADYKSHAEKCDRGCNNNSINNDRYKKEIQTLKEKLEEAENEKRVLQKCIKKLEAQLKARPNVPALFTGSYNFKREDVVQLSQLISRYLENKPTNIDANRIFNCVRSCYTDLQKNYSDNPKHYYMDMRMLLTTCAASTWFTDRQRSNIKQWLNERNWS